MLFEIISLFIEDKWFHGIFIQIISLWYISFWWTIWSKNSSKIRSKKHNACKVKHIKQSPFRQKIYLRCLWKKSTLNVSAHSFKYNFILGILSLLHYTTSSRCIYTHTLRKQSRGTRFSRRRTPQKSFTTNFEGDSFDSTTIIRRRTLLRGFFAPSRAPLLDLSGNPTHTTEGKLAYTQKNRRFNVGFESKQVRGYVLHSTFHLNDRRILSRCRSFAKRMGSWNRRRDRWPAFHAA